jgi:hypothetical protein
MEFGFYTSHRRVVVDNIEVKPMWDLDEKISLMYKKAIASNGWIYPPLIEARQDFDEKEKFKTNPKLPATFFYSEATHSITIFPHDSEKLRFLILAFGFLNGIYLSPAGYLCIRRIPYKTGKLTGVILIRDDAEKGLSSFSTLYDKLNPEKRNLAFAILHWFSLGQSYSYAWDNFDAQYKVLDAIYKFSGLSAAFHAERPLILAKHFGLKIPKWAEIYSGRKSCLSEIRNELIHEAKYAGQPIGYCYHKENFGFEFARFNSKLIAASFGLKSRYLHSDPCDRNTHAWSFS